MPNLSASLVHPASFPLSYVSREPQGHASSGFPFNALCHHIPCMNFSFDTSSHEVLSLWQSIMSCAWCVVILWGNCLGIHYTIATMISLSPSTSFPFSVPWSDHFTFLYPYTFWKCPCNSEDSGDIHWPIGMLSEVIYKDFYMFLHSILSKHYSPLLHGCMKFRIVNIFSGICSRHGFCVVVSTFCCLPSDVLLTLVWSSSRACFVFPFHLQDLVSQPEACDAKPELAMSPKYFLTCALYFMCLLSQIPCSSILCSLLTHRTKNKGCFFCKIVLVLSNILSALELSSWVTSSHRALSPREPLSFLWC